MRYIILVLIISTLLSCRQSRTETSKEATETVETNKIVLSAAQAKNASVETGRAQVRNISSVLKVTGRIDVPPQNIVSVSFPLGGYLKHTILLPGMHIRKGAVIATMEDQQYIQLQQDYLTARARHRYLEAEYLRQRELNQTKAASDKVYQQAEADYRSNQILIASLAQKLRLIGINPERLYEGNISRTVNVYAPIDGYVSAVNVNVGRYVAPADVLFELVNPTDIHLVLTVFEKDISKLSIGQKLYAYTNNSETKYPCEVLLISKNVSTERSVEVHCHFEKYDKALVPGMYMNADIPVSAINSLAVPEDAAVRYQNKDFIFIVLGNNSFEMKEVVTGSTQDGWVTIADSKDVDLNKQPIVTHNAYTLLMALKNTAE